MIEVSPGRYGWLVLHRVDGREHPAWYQRALLPGDFRPGSRPLPNYVLTLTGESPDPSETPTCGTCGLEPRVEDLEIVERTSGRRDFLLPFRDVRHPAHISWDRAGKTLPQTCYVCNCFGKLSQVGYILLCEACEENLRRGGE